MRMKKFLVPILLIWCFSIAVSAPSELERLVNALQTKYARLTSLAADFVQIYTAPSERTRRESGHLMLKKPGKMRWDYTTPETKLYVSDGKVIYEYLPAERVATRTTIKETQDLRAPFMFLLGRGDLRRDFKRIEFASESPVRAGDRVLRLIPKRASEFRELLLEVESQSLQLVRLSFIDQNGARSDFLFSNVREQATIDDAQFIFKPPAGVAVRVESQTTR